MKLAIIAAFGANNVIGKNNSLPWKLPSDLRRFKKLTLEHTVIMGRKTFESIGKPLPQRNNIIISRQAGYLVPGATVVQSLAAALQACQEESKEVFILGGATLYEQTLLQSERLYLTKIHQNFEGDAFFPKLNWDKLQIISQEQGTENSLSYSFFVLEWKK